MRTILLQSIRLYRATSVLRRPCCRFYPTCSAYMAGCIEKYGVVRGVLLGVARLLRCQPLCPGGIDDVPERLHWT